LGPRLQVRLEKVCNTCKQGLFEKIPDETLERRLPRGREAYFSEFQGGPIGKKVNNVHPYT
jgi:hypothetical protein